MEMKENRVEICSDGVFAITISIMMLELNVPHEADLSGLKVHINFYSYVLSFFKCWYFL